jgi:hypothetical protein
MTERIDYILALRNCGRVFVDTAIPVLEKQQAAAITDLYDPVEDEVIGGLFARIFRFLQTLVLDYHLLAEDLGRSVLRMMLESLFYLRFLIEQNQHELFQEFQKYGIGQEKLYKLQLRKLLEEGVLKDSDELRAFIDDNADDEIWDELVNVKLKNFEDIRKVAKKAQLEEAYALYYQPDSVIVHGHWPVLRQYHLRQCTEPLHRGHWQPHFHLPHLEPLVIERALSIFGDAYFLWVKRYNLSDEIGPLIEAYLNCSDSISEQPEEQPDVDRPQ